MNRGTWFPSPFFFRPLSRGKQIGKSVLALLPLLPLLHLLFFPLGWQLNDYPTFPLLKWVPSVHLTSSFSSIPLLLSCKAKFTVFPLPPPPPLSLSLLSALQRVPRRDIFDYERPPLFAGNEHQRFEWRSPRMLLMCRLRVYPPLTNVIYHYGRGRFSMREPSLHPLCLPVNLLHRKWSRAIEWKFSINETFLSFLFFLRITSFTKFRINRIRFRADFVQIYLRYCILVSILFISSKKIENCLDCTNLLQRKFLNISLYISR